MPTSGDVVAVDLGAPAGREAGFLHPAVVVTAQRVLDAGTAVVQVVPLTSQVRGFASEVEITPDPSNGLDCLSAAQCQHVRAIATVRMGEQRGNVGPVVPAQIREVLALIIGMPD